MNPVDGASNSMNKNSQKSNAQRARERKALPFFVEFVKFSTGFAAIIAVALLTLHVASAAM